MIRAIDSWVLRGFERFSHFTQKMFGVRAVHWFKVSLAIAMLGYLCIDLPDALARHATISTVAIVICVLIWMPSFWETGHDPSDGLRNSREVQTKFVYGRVILLLIAILLLPRTLQMGDCAILGLACAEYFHAVTDLPPGISKLKTVWLTLQGWISQPPVEVHG